MVDTWTERWRCVVCWAGKGLHWGPHGPTTKRNLFLHEYSSSFFFGQPPPPLRFSLLSPYLSTMAEQSHFIAIHLYHFYFGGIGVLGFLTFCPYRALAGTEYILKCERIVRGAGGVAALLLLPPARQLPTSRYVNEKISQIVLFVKKTNKIIELESLAQMYGHKLRYDPADHQEDVRDSRIHYFLIILILKLSSVKFF